MPWARISFVRTLDPVTGRTEIARRGQGERERSLPRSLRGSGRVLLPPAAIEPIVSWLSYRRHPRPCPLGRSELSMVQSSNGTVV